MNPRNSSKPIAGSGGAVVRQVPLVEVIAPSGSESVRAAKGVSLILSVISVIAPFAFVKFGKPGLLIGAGLGVAAGLASTAIDCSLEDRFGCSLGFLGGAFGLVGHVGAGGLKTVAKIWSGHADGLGVWVGTLDWLSGG
jgi:hypothetical protein